MLGLDPYERKTIKRALVSGEYVFCLLNPERGKEAMGLRKR